MACGLRPLTAKSYVGFSRPTWQVHKGEAPVGHAVAAGPLLRSAFRWEHGLDICEGPAVMREPVRANLDVSVPDALAVARKQRDRERVLRVENMPARYANALHG